MAGGGGRGELRLAKAARATRASARKRCPPLISHDTRNGPALALRRGHGKSARSGSSIKQRTAVYF